MTFVVKPGIEGYLKSNISGKMCTNTAQLLIRAIILFISDSVLIFMTCGLIQMTIWAQQKHRRYKKEFSKYPRNRTSIIPFVI